MTAGSEIQRLNVDHIESVVDLVRASFDVSLLPYLVYGQAGIHHYLAAAQPRAGLKETRSAWVCLDAETVVGYAEFDLTRSPIAHLSYVCVKESHRGRGIARRLIAHFARERPEFTSLSLDVFEDNTVARSIYHGMGLEERDVSEWIVRPLPKEREGSLIVNELPQSLAVHSCFGFSSWSMRYGDRSVQLGRLGDACLRVHSQSDFLDDGFLAAARAVFPAAQEALIITPANRLPDSVASRRVLLRSIRMLGRLEPVGANRREGI